jgi:hypothetical protein
MIRPKLAAAIVSLGLGLAANASAAAGWRAGLWYGPQRFNDAKIRSTYGQQAVFRPAVEAVFGRRLTAGLAYELGYRRDGNVGLDKTASTLSMSGLNIVIGYEIPLKSIALYARAGYGLYFYKQTINDTLLTGYAVDHRQSTVLAGVGIRVRTGGSLFLSAEAEYVPLKVHPYDTSVDLGGLRLFVGAGFASGPSPKTP